MSEHDRPEAVTPVEHDVVKESVPLPPFAMAAQGCAVQTRLSVDQLVASQDRVRKPAYPGVEQVSVHVPPCATVPEAQSVV